MDLSTQAVVDTTTLHIKDAGGELMYSDEARTLPCEIILYGPGSNAFATVSARQSARALKRMEDNDGKVTAPTPDEARKNMAEDLADLTAGFNNITYSPAPDAHGKELFKAVYAAQGLGYIVKQVNQTVTDWGKFKGA